MQRYFAKEKIQNNFILEDSDIHHIIHVMRMKENTEIEVVFQNQLYLCYINYVNDIVNIVLKKEMNTISSKMPAMVLVLPFLKEQKMDYILQKATELGVTEFVFMPMERSVIKIEPGQIAKKCNRWLKICKEASEQSKRVEIPQITIIHKREELQKWDGLKLLCSTTESVNSLKNTLKKQGNYDKIISVIGPEGGISPQEEKLFIEQGFLPIHLGPRILRVETVPLFLMSVINYEYME